MEMGERIKERRLAMNLTQEELAQKLGLQKSAIAKYENGRVENIKRSVISKMADILECTPSYLMGWETSDKTGTPIIFGSELNRIFEKLSVEFGKDKDYLISQFFSYDASNLPKECRILNENNIRQILASSFSKNLSSDTIAAHKDGENFTKEELSKIEEYKRLLIAARPKE